MRIKEEIQLDFKDVLIQPQRSELNSRSEVDLTRTFKFKYSPISWTGIPIISANMDGTGTIDMAKSLSKHQCMTALHKHYEARNLIQFFLNGNKKSEDRNENAPGNTFYSLGITDKDVEKFEYVVSKTGYWNEEKANGVKMVCIDVANGYMQRFVEFCKVFREKHPTVVIMAGNVVTGDMTQELALSGVDIIKCGIGGGGVCTTRRIAGVGRPQLSTIIDCANAAHGLGAQICSDGGCTVPADVSKAFCANSDFVMLGSMLAGHEECEMPLSENNKFKFYGMSSEEAMKKHSGGVASHRAAEGKIVEIENRGPVSNTILEIQGGIRSTGAYIGAKKLKEYSKRTEFYRVSMQTNDVFGKS